jgi:F-type H+-transporting ATPase subunit a
LSNDPIHQFNTNNEVDVPLADLPPLFGVDVGDLALNNAAVMMLAGVGLTAAFYYWAMKPAALVPGRAQVVAETGYNFIHGMVKDAAGEEGVKRFFPFVFTLFLFIFAANMLGMFPYFFTPTSQIIVTATMAMMVFLTVLFVGFAKNGLKFFKLFVPSGVPWPLLIVVTPIEVLSFFSRPLSHSVRLWANVLAGHLVLKVFAGFIPMMTAAGTEMLNQGNALGALLAAGSILPLIMTIALYALEFLVAFLQAYVFALLTCLYLNDALHPGH